MITLQVDLEPIDPLMFGDNRSARAGEDHRRRGQELSPATLFGAIGSRIAAALGARPGHWSKAEPVLGPFSDDPAAARDTAELAGYSWSAPNRRLWAPKPQTCPVVHAGRAFQALEPMTPAAARGEEGESRTMSSLLFERPVQAETDSASDTTLDVVEDPLLVDGHFLEAALTSSPRLRRLPIEAAVRRREDFSRSELRIGVGIDNRTHCAVPGRLFSRPYRRFARQTRSRGTSSAGFTAWYRVHSLEGQSPDRWNGTGFLGGDRRRVRMSFCETVEPPFGKAFDAVLAAAPSSRGFFAYLLTPALAEPAPPRFAGRNAIAAALGRGRHISGFTTSGSLRGPRPISTLWSEGSVFFFYWRQDEGDPELRRRLIRQHWLGSLSDRGSALGFGRLLLGVW